mmetsp:Transcript_85373/g.204561  ORF Transcript_85373/g.204561 Transcript_85373/m.204561 type:complete len:210 (-) Transcript_85373:24-653(-)
MKRKVPCNSSGGGRPRSTISRRVCSQLAWAALKMAICSSTCLRSKALRTITIIVRSDMMLVGWRVPLQRFTMSFASLMPWILASSDSEVSSRSLSAASSIGSSSSVFFPSPVLGLFGTCGSSCNGSSDLGDMVGDPRPVSFGSLLFMCRSVNKPSMRCMDRFSCGLGRCSGLSEVVSSPKEPLGKGSFSKGGSPGLRTSCLGEASGGSS